MVSAALSYKYEDHLVHYINTVRETFKAPPTTPMVIATLGQTLKNATGANDGNEGYLMQAMLNVDGDNGKYPAFKGNVKTVYSHPYSLGGASYSHYNYNPMTYMNIGEAMGQAMVSLL